jgi:hypothetical protein
MPLPRAWAKFTDKHGEQVAELLQIKRKDLRSFLNAIALGAAETQRIRLRRTFGRIHLPKDNPDMAEYLRAAQQYALLGTGPFKPLG